MCVLVCVRACARARAYMCVCVLIFYLPAPFLYRAILVLVIYKQTDLVKII